MLRVGKLILLLLLPLSLHARATVCLNMIVKNEAHVIERCLESVRPLIDSWVIVDTGSTDGTQEVIRKCLANLPGELHERPWKNFAHNRNEALALAKDKADYILIIDADDTITYHAGFALPELQYDAYLMPILHGGLKFARIQLVKSCLNWSWQGVLHEYVSSSEMKTEQLLPGVTMVYGGDGARSRNPRKYLDDALVLEVALAEEPDNSRYVFYLAQSYREGGELEKAYRYYQQRVEMGGTDQEVYLSLFQIARLDQLQGRPCINSYWAAYRRLPCRAEPLYYLASWYRMNNQFMTAYQLTKAALLLGACDERLLKEQWIYDFGLLLEHSICAFYVGQYQEAYDLSLQLLQQPDLPPPVRSCIQGNLSHILPLIGEK
jgi:glycosyltransferase involved in cell wall biosynthesis